MYLKSIAIKLNSKIDSDNIKVDLESIGIKLYNEYNNSKYVVINSFGDAIYANTLSDTSYKLITLLQFNTIVSILKNVDSFYDTYYNTVVIGLCRPDPSRYTLIPNDADLLIRDETHYPHHYTFYKKVNDKIYMKSRYMKDWIISKITSDIYNLYSDTAIWHKTCIQS